MTSTTSTSTISTAANDWRAFKADKIPSKGVKLPPLFFDTLYKLEEEKYQQQQQQSQQNENEKQQKLSILELGCGIGELSHWLVHHTHRHHLQHDATTTTTTTTTETTTTTNTVSDRIEDAYNFYREVVGMDVNQEAIERARQTCPEATFVVADISTINNHDTNDNISAKITNNDNDDISNNNNNDDDDDDNIVDRPNYYDFCILQLLLSVVGGKLERQQTLRYAASQLKSNKNGIIYLSCSGVSDDINESYAKLYRQDEPLTGEAYTYFSRGDATNTLTTQMISNTNNTSTSQEENHNKNEDTNNNEIDSINNKNQSSQILYTTHHFTTPELSDLLATAGFVDIHIEQIKETSSRRPNESAYFLYATARKK